MSVDEAVRDVMVENVVGGEADVDHSGRERTPAELRALAEQANERLEGASAEEILSWAFAEFGSRLAVTSSMVDTVMIHLAEQVAPGIDVIFLDTGYHFAETIGTRDAVESIFDVHVVNVPPELSVAEQDVDLRQGSVCPGTRSVLPDAQGRAAGQGARAVHGLGHRASGGPTASAGRTHRWSPIRRASR